MAQAEIAPRWMETTRDPIQDVPFVIKRDFDHWFLVTNTTVLAQNGYTQEEIDGAVHLEEERLKRWLAVGTLADVEGLKAWQELGHQDPQTASFQSLFERLAALKALEHNNSERARGARSYLASSIRRVPPTSYINQLYRRVLMTELGENVPIVDDVVEQMAAGLEAIEIIDDRQVTCLEALTSPTLSYTSKWHWWQNRFLPRIIYLREKELAQVAQPTLPPDQEKAEEPEARASAPTPSRTQDEYDQHRGREKRGKEDPTFIISPYHLGYWETESYDQLDESTGRLRKSPSLSSKYNDIALVTKQITDSSRKIEFHSGTNLFSLPLAEGFYLTADGLQSFSKAGIQVMRDDEGHIYVKSATNVPCRIEIAQNSPPIPDQGIVLRDLAIVETYLPEEINTELERIRNLSLDSIGKARQWQKFVNTYFRYPQDNEVEGIYAKVDSAPTQRLSTLAALRQADCYLAREFFIGGLKRLALNDLEWRAARGYFVGTKNKNGTASIDSSKAHAWVKVRPIGQTTWTIIDPTPYDDPLLTFETQLDNLEKFSPPALSAEDYKQLRVEIEQKEARTGKPTSSAYETYVLELAKEVNLPPEKVKLILDEIDKAHQLTDKEGRNLSQRLTEQFDHIIQELIRARAKHLGLVPMSLGYELVEPVETLLDLQQGSLDPGGFVKRWRTEEEVQCYGGFDLEMIVDKSGSMDEPWQGQVKYIEQRKIAYLILQAVHQFSAEAIRRRAILTTPLNVRSSLTAFHAPEIVNLVGGHLEIQHQPTIQRIKPLAEELSFKQIVNIWDNLGDNIGGGTPDYLGLQAVLDTITPEEIQLLKEKKLLKIIVLIRDGESDNPTLVNDIMEKLRDMNIIVADFLIGEKGAPLSQLVEEVAEKVIESAKLLMPRKVR